MCIEDRYIEDEAQDILKKLVARKYLTDLLRVDQTSHPIQPKKTKLLTNNQILHNYEGLLLMTRKEAIKPEDIQETYSRSANLQDMLITGSLQRNHILRDSQPCGRPRCKTCPHVTTKATIAYRKDTYKIRGKFSCQSHDMVYSLKCSICKIQCIRQTENTLNMGCGGHVTNMKAYNLNHVWRDYKSYNHTTDDYTVCAIDKETDKNKRLRLEEAWMNILDILFPKGLNSRW